MQSVWLTIWVHRLRRKITTPHASLSESLALLTRLERAASLARRAARFTVLARRLSAQMDELAGPTAFVRETTPGTNESHSAGESSLDLRGNRQDRALAEAALTLAEIRELSRFCHFRRVCADDIRIR